VKNWVRRSLTRAFGRAAARDRMLADLYVAVAQETISDLVTERAKKLAYTYHDQYEIGQCVVGMLDYIAYAEAPRSAIDLSNALLRVIKQGPVFDAIMSRAGRLHFCDSISYTIKKETALYLNSLRLNGDNSRATLMQMYVYDKDLPRRQFAVYPRPTRVTPLEFQKHMKI
jgi:hypothetical protein